MLLTCETSNVMVQTVIDQIIKADRSQSGSRRSLSTPKNLQNENLKNIRQATEEAWTANYIGDAPSLLFNAIKLAREGLNIRAEYGNFFPIIQGSGTGKSRLVDQLAGMVFLIPIVLRRLDDTTGIQNLISSTMVTLF
ncbi:hypothetical protein H2248_001346 [Termitomyces sp. 'cryptogamus']|nr:hypothetical protein H2248_001346 [Termitomyces sp. 'cryptogamus']